MKYRRAYLGVGLALLIGACVPHRMVPPGFAGVPEALERSADFELRLSSNAREELVSYLAGTRSPEDFPDAARERSVEAQYGALLQTLGARDLHFGDLVALFAPEPPLAIHDARVDEDEAGVPIDLDQPQCCGFVRGEYVWVFYRRRLVPMVHEMPRHRAWLQSAPRDDSEDPAYAGLVVFPKSFAIATPAN